MRPSEHTTPGCSTPSTERKDRLGGERERGGKETLHGGKREALQANTLTSRALMLRLRGLDGRHLLCQTSPLSDKACFLLLPITDPSTGRKRECVPSTVSTGSAVSAPKATPRRSAVTSSVSSTSRGVASSGGAAESSSTTAVSSEAAAVASACRDNDGVSRKLERCQPGR